MKGTERGTEVTSRIETDMARIDADLAAIGAARIDPDEGLETPGLETPGLESHEVQIDMVVDAEGVLTFEPPAPPMPADADNLEDNLEDVLEAVPTATSRHRIAFSDLPGNTIHEGIAKLDAKLNANRGLRRLDPASGALVPVDGRVEGPTLLIVHGTFSRAEQLIDGMNTGDPELLRTMAQRYGGNVLTFDYATMSRHAIANAIALASALRDVTGPIDVVSHSQGGLVTRYWLELLDRERLATTRSIFVAGTLAGTSLAAPPALERALGLVANFANKVKWGASLASKAVPVFGYVSGLFGLLHKLTGFLGKTPVLDAGVGLVPGFVGMSRVGTNAELAELRGSVREVPAGYFAVTGDFEPEPAGWRFWRRLVSRTADGAADRLFAAPNDLVVDTLAQTELSEAHDIADRGTDAVLRFATPNPTVHHTNYFEQARTLRFIADKLAR